jgi:hypothetical protein
MAREFEEAESLERVRDRGIHLFTCNEESLEGQEMDCIDEGQHSRHDPANLERGCHQLHSLPRQLREQTIQLRVPSFDPDPWRLGQDGSVRMHSNHAQRPDVEREQSQHGSTRRGSNTRQLKKNINWSDEQLERAKRAVDRGARITSAADFYGIPRSTLRSHVQGITLGRKRGKTSILTPSEEAKLVAYLH